MITQSHGKNCRRPQDESHPVCVDDVDDFDELALHTVDDGHTRPRSACHCIQGPGGLVLDDGGLAAHGLGLAARGDGGGDGFLELLLTVGAASDRFGGFDLGGDGDGGGASDRFGGFGLGGSDRFASFGGGGEQGVFQLGLALHPGGGGGGEGGVGGDGEGGGGRDLLAGTGEGDTELAVALGVKGGELLAEFGDIGGGLRADAGEFFVVEAGSELGSPVNGNVSDMRQIGLLLGDADRHGGRAHLIAMGVHHTAVGDCGRFHLFAEGVHHTAVGDCGRAHLFAVGDGGDGGVELKSKLSSAAGGGGGLRLDAVV